MTSMKLNYYFSALPRSLQDALETSWLDWLQGNIDDAEFEIQILLASRRARSAASLAVRSKLQRRARVHHAFAFQVQRSPARAERQPGEATGEAGDTQSPDRDTPAAMGWIGKDGRP